MNASAIYIIGGGGHAKVAIATAEALNIGIAAVFDDAAPRAGRAIIGYNIEGAIPDADWWRNAHATALIAIGDGSVRKLIAARCPTRWQTLVHPTACVHPSVRLGAGTLVCAGAIIQPDAIIGDHAIINSGAVVEHDCRVGDFSHVAPTACLAGGAAIGEGSLIGAGAVISPGGRVGDWVTVGAGAVVIHDIADGLTVAGVPAKPIL